MKRYRRPAAALSVRIPVSFQSVQAGIFRLPAFRLLLIRGMCNAILH